MPAFLHSKKGIGHRVRLDDLSLPITDENSGGDGLEDRFLSADMLSQLALGVTHLLSMRDIEANIYPFANMTVNSTHGRPTDQKKTIFASMLHMTLQFVCSSMSQRILPDGSDFLSISGTKEFQKTCTLQVVTTRQRSFFQDHPGGAGDPEHIARCLHYRAKSLTRRLHFTLRLGYDFFGRCHRSTVDRRIRHIPHLVRCMLKILFHIAAPLNSIHTHGEIRHREALPQITYFYALLKLNISTNLIIYPQ